jgi:hypothetical protein
MIFVFVFFLKGLLHRSPFFVQNIVVSNPSIYMAQMK